MQQPSPYGLDAKIFFRHDVSNDQYYLVLRFPQDEFILPCCVHMFENFKKIKPDVTLVRLIPDTAENKADFVAKIINDALDDKSSDDLPF